MAGLAPISLQQRCGLDGRPYPGARAYFYEADTLMPITVYQDYGLGVPHPNPVEANAYGIFPPIYIDEAEGFYRLRITTAEGVTLTDMTTLPVIGPSGGGGGSETPVDPTAILQTGDLFPVDGAGSRVGAVRANGRTIGNALSGATERANQDCEALFLTLYARHDNTICPVLGGRGASAVADWEAGKQLTLPDYRGRGPLGLDTMGNSAANRLAGVTFITGNSTTPGSTGGAARITLTTGQLPAHSHTGTTNASGKHTHNYDKASGPQQKPTDSGSSAFTGHTPTATSEAGEHTHTFTTNTTGNGEAITVLDPFFLVTWYYKL
jgi:microcystin-dependent protein